MRRWIVTAFATLSIALGSYWATLQLVPYALMELAVRRVSAAAPVNRFTHSPPVDARRQAIVRPSPDLLYSVCPFDLGNGPVEVAAAPIPGRYSSISVFDARTDVVFVRNDEQMAGRPMRVVLALQGQAVPDGLESVRVAYDRGIVLQRVLLSDPAEAATIDPLRSAASCRTLTGDSGR